MLKHRVINLLMTNKDGIQMPFGYDTGMKGDKPSG